MKKNNELKLLCSVFTKIKDVNMVLLIALIMTGCETLRNNVVVMVKNNEVLVKDASSNEERLIDCTKKDQNHPKLQEDLPYFHEGDTVKFKPAKGYTYDGFRAYPITGSKLEYNPDTIQIRKDRERIKQFKADTIIQKTR